MSSINEENYKKTIKNYLGKKLTESGHSASKLLEIINTKYQYNFNRTSFVNIFNIEQPAFNLTAIAAICKELDISIEYLLSMSSPLHTGDQSDLKTHEQPNIPQIALDDHHYLGDYYGYYYSASRKNKKLEEFLLHIGNEDGTFAATLTLLLPSITETEDENVVHPGDVLYGTPIFVFPGTIYLVMTNNDGRLVILVFNYADYPRWNMYFRNGIFVSISTEVSRPPFVERFVMFDKQVKEENKKYLYGLLAMTDDTIYLPNAELQKLKDGHLNQFDERDLKAVNDLFSEFENLISQTYDSVFSIQETQILAKNETKMERTEIIRALAVLKQLSLCAHSIVTPENNDYAHFGKML